MTLPELFTLIATSAGFVVTIVGSSCGFMYWMLSAFEKRFEDKLNKMEQDIQAIAFDIKDQRKRTDQLYEILIGIVHKG